MERHRQHRAMADLVANAAAAAGASVDKFTASEFNVSSAGDYTGFALGCPAMGAEQLEESEFEPMYQDLRGSLSGKPVALFGSYGWGDGEWIRTWAEDAEAPVPVWSLSLSWPTAPPTATRDCLRSPWHRSGQCLIFSISIHTGRGSDAPPSLFARQEPGMCGPCRAVSKKIPLDKKQSRS